MTLEDGIRAKYYSDTLFATRYTFRHSEGRKFIVGEHHKMIAEALDKVFSGEITRLIITIPPRYSKTEMAVKTFIAKGMALNPKSKFIHLSYSDNLALDNSERTKDIVQEEWYQTLFPQVKIKQDSKAKNKWLTTDGGGVFARSTAGQVTGFGAGTVEDDEIITEIGSTREFSGAIIIDDPIKPEDAYSATMRDKVNNRFENTIRSRVNSRYTPIIIIMQRLHKHDLVGYLNETEPDTWTTLSLPAIIKDDNGNETPLYPFKHTLDELYKIRSANRFVFETQYMQNPMTINEKLWLFAFDSNKHVGKVELNKQQPIYLSFDFNRNPLCAIVAQIYDDTVYGVEAIQIQDATIQSVCKYIHQTYGDAFYLVTGDASGKSLTTVNTLDNFGIIKNYFGLTKNQMQYSGSNPRLQDSRYFVNSVFEQGKVILDKDKCKPLIYDFENVMSDDENKPVKDSRSKADQQSDSLDAFRYLLHRYAKHILI